MRLKVFDQLVTNFCAHIALQTGCQETLKASGAQTHLSQEMDASEKYLIKLSEKQAYDLIGEKPIRYSIFTGFIVNSFVTKSVQVKPPGNFLCDEISLEGSNIGSNSSYDQRFMINCKWIME